MMQGSLAAKLRVLRAQQGLTLVEASERLGVDRHTLRRLELGGGRRPQYPTLTKIAEGYRVPVEELLEAGEPVPLESAPPSAVEPAPPSTIQIEAEKPALAEASSPAREWADDMGAPLHGLTGEDWDRHLASLVEVGEVDETWRALQEEAKMLHAALSLDKWTRPEDKRRRRELSQGLRDLRVHRYADLAAEAAMLHARDLVNQIFHEIEEEARA